MTLFLGVDPGLTGAIALVDADGRLHMIEDMPITARGNGRVKHEVDSAGLIHLLRPHGADIVHGVLEVLGARPGQGVASMFSLGHSFGTASAVLSCLGVPFELLSAAKWKRLVELPAEKTLVLAAARRRWPAAPLARAKHHGRAEALFMALLAMRRQRGL
jgi:hypothetical protein